MAGSLEGSANAAVTRIAARKTWARPLRWRSVRVCLVYDRLYPQSIGGAERWMRDLAVRLVEEGHEVTYLTTVQWLPGDPPSLAGVQVLGLAATGAIYGESRRTLGPPLRFGAAVLRHLWRHG